MAKVYNGRGIVLGTIKYGESSVIAQVYTESGGRQSFMVQGVRSTRGHGSKMAALQPLFLVEYVAREGKMGRMSTMLQVNSAYISRNTVFDVRRSTMSLFMAEVIYRLLPEGEHNSHLFNFLWDSVIDLNTIEHGVSNYHLFFLTRFTPFLGFSPRNNYQPGYWFCVKDGEYVAQKPQALTLFSLEISELMHTFANSTVEQLGGVQLSRNQRVLYLDALIEYCAYHMDVARSIRSVDVLRELF